MTELYAFTMAPFFVVGWFFGRFVFFRQYTAAIKSLPGNVGRSVASLKNFFLFILLFSSLVVFIFAFGKWGIGAFFMAPVMGLIVSLIDPVLIYLTYKVTGDPGVLPYKPYSR